MESLVDIVTTVFQAVLAVAIVFTAGYAVNSSQDVVFAKVSPKISGMQRKWAHCSRTSQSLHEGYYCQL